MNIFKKNLIFDNKDQTKSSSVLYNPVQWLPVCLLQLPRADTLCTTEKVFSCVSTFLNAGDIYELNESCFYIFKVGLFTGKGMSMWLPSSLDMEFNQGCVTSNDTQHDHCKIIQQSIFSYTQ